MSNASTEERVAAILAGNVRSAARLMRQIEDNPAKARSALARLHPHTGKAHVIGVTGNPGAGKSTLVSRLIGHFRAIDKRVGVVAVDPSSPFSGGAILGDRIRMMDHAADPGVFIRSSSSRGALGGVSYSTEDIALVMEAFGCDVIIVETVGVGQAEVDIVRLAHTVLVVMTPGYGDDIQALKAGILEIADLFVVNKADHPGVEAIERQLSAMWKLRPAFSADPDDWKPPVIRTIAVEGSGIEELGEAIDKHKSYLESHDSAPTRRRARTKQMLLRLVREELERAAAAGVLATANLSKLLDAIEERSEDPYSVAQKVASKLLAD